MVFSMSIEYIDYELCTTCGICVRSCPTDVIRLDKTIKKVVFQYPEDCMLCELCAVDCPVDAIYISPEKELTHILSWG